MKSASHEKLNYQPVDQSQCNQHQVVTATGEGPLLYGKQPIFIDDDDDDEQDDVTLSKDHSFPAKKVCYQPRKIATDIIKPAKLKLGEVDVRGGTQVETEPVSLKDNKKKRNVEKFEEIDTQQENTPENLNIKLRYDPWLDAIIRSGKKAVDGYVLSENLQYVGLEEDNFEDYSHLNTRVYDDFLKGFVVQGTNNAVSRLLNSASSLKFGTHGVIVDQSMPPSFDGLFEEGGGQQYLVLEELGTGSFGTVSLCQHYQGPQYVKKVINKKFNKKEVEVLMQLSHPNITSFRGYIFRDGAHEILMEYGGDSLKTVMQKNKHQYQEVFTSSVVTELSYQGFSGLDYMYDILGILHLDIKPENICIKLDPPTLKLTDFGTSKTPEQSINFSGWTPEYMSPEACRLLIAVSAPNLPAGFTEELTGKTDVFSFGLVISFMLTGSHSVSTLWPESFTEESFMQWRTQYIKHLAFNPQFMQQLAVKDEWPKDLRDLLCYTLSGNTSDRISARQACHFITTAMNSNRVNIPTLLSSGSLGSPAPSDVPTADSMYDAPGSPGDFSLSRSPGGGGGGKDIKSQLRRKIRRKSAAPYERQANSVAAAKDKAAPAVGGLPIFADLGIDD